MTQAHTLSPLQREIVSGLTAGCATSVIVHPLDLVKLKLQLLSTGSQPRAGKYAAVLRGILRPVGSGLGLGHGRQHYAGLYRGLAINVLGNSVAWAMYFASYRYAKELLQGPGPTSSGPDPLAYLAAGAAGGVFTSLVTNPVWVLKTRIMGAEGPRRLSIAGTCRDIVRHEGWRGLARGLAPSVLGVSQGAIYFMVYDTMKQRRLASRNSDRLSTLDTIAITSCSKMVSTTAVYPLQLIKSNMQSAQLAAERWSMRRLVAYIYARGGLPGLYSGLGTNLLKAVPTTCITFCIYEGMKGYL